MDKVVTIGFCIKNVEKTVGAALAGIFAQDYPIERTELIIVEGYSSDTTSKIVDESLKKSRTSFRRFHENKGLGMARQIVVENASGRYIIWVDGDMFLPESYVRRQVEFMEENADVGIAGGKYAVNLGQGLAADLENIVYVVDSLCGERGASQFGYLPGTEGAIFRTQAMRQIKGFDTQMKGAAEDTEVAYRMKAKGWKLAVTQEVFTESTRLSWSSLWEQYSWYGKGGHYISHKNSNMITLWKMSPPAGFIAGLLRCSGAYSISHKKSMFLLPIHYTFKRIAWYSGFLKAHSEGYGHKQSGN